MKYLIMILLGFAITASLFSQKVTSKGYEYYIEIDKTAPKEIVKKMVESITKKNDVVSFRNYKFGNNFFILVGNVPFIKTSVSQWVSTYGFTITKFMQGTFSDKDILAMKKKMYFNRSKDKKD